MKNILASALLGTSFMLGAVSSAMAPAAAQTGHDKACLVVDNETDQTVHVSTMPPQGSMGFGARLNVGAHKKEVAMLMGSPLRSPDWSKVKVDPTDSTLSWTWNEDFHQAPGLAPNETCDGAWVLTVR
jgi:hypothetical protein